MEPPAKAQKLLSVPEAGSAHYAQNFIRLAVCELRFPTLFEVEAETPPLALSKALRKEYPTHELLKNVNVNLGGVAHSNAHAFRSKKARWSVTLRAAALSLETSRYDSFDEFAERLVFVLKAAEGTIDSDFFTRVGLRYINIVPCEPEAAAEWVNPALVGPLAAGTYGTVNEYWQRVQGPTAVGGYTFTHGVQVQPGSPPREYLLDLDFFKEDVPVAETLSVVKKLHELEFSMFRWSLGPKAKEFLGTSSK
jgi:uncharacterized protein (TIGR04255 family)